MTNVRICYPGFLTRAVTFSMDDGRVEQDARLLEVMRAHGFLGTFNLPRTDALTKEEYRSLYQGYEIANHCKHHPYAFDDDVEYKIAKEPFNPETADGEYIYPHPERPAFYYFKRSVGWRLMTDPDTYIECVRACHGELEAIFGKGSVRGYAWPFYEQNSRKIREFLATFGYTNVRGSGLMLDRDGFAFPKNPLSWRCNANHTNLNEMMSLYSDMPDDGELKLFAFGVHASDYMRDEVTWDKLLRFADTYGGKTDKFWYATVGDIFAYRRAADGIREEGGRVTNPTDALIYINVKGDNVRLHPGESIALS